MPIKTSFHKKKIWQGLRRSVYIWLTLYAPYVYHEFFGLIDKYWTCSCLTTNYIQMCDCTVLYDTHGIKSIDWMFNFKKVKNLSFYCISPHLLYFSARKWWFKGKEFFMGKTPTTLVPSTFKHVIHNAIRWNLAVSVPVLYKWSCSASIIFY